MLTSVQRIILKAKPAKDNKRFNEWETTTLVYFVDEPDMITALTLVRENMKLNKWELLYYEEKGTLIQEKVENSERVIIDAFNYAKKHKIFLKEIHDNFMAGKKKSQYFCPPKIGEEFIDEIIFDIGGRRLTDEEKQFEEELNADYILDNYAFELKDLMDEGLDKVERRKKISELFSNYYTSQEPIYIDPNLLSDTDKLKYISIITSPLEKKIKKAFKQTTATKNRLSSHYKTGLIYINSGYLSLPHELFTEEIKRYIKKNDLHFDQVITLSVTAQSNGFDMYVVFSNDPIDSSDETIKKFIKSWNTNSENIMTKLVRGEIKEFSSPQKPISFNNSGIDFYWLPYAIERFSFDEISNKY